MRILVALDTGSYSRYVVHEVARLAMNTWADVTFLGVELKRVDVPAVGASSIKALPITRSLEALRDEFMSYFPDETTSPYVKRDMEYRFVKMGRSLWEEMCICRGRKEFKVKIRFGTPSRQVIAEAQEAGSDLVVLGCSKGTYCSWEQERNGPEKIAKGAPCSVLIVKEERKPEKIVCCLDHSSVSQASLELINQMVTLHKTDLDLVALTESYHLKEEVDQRMREILRYYTKQKIRARVTTVDVSMLDEFIREAAERSLIALWMGHQSLLSQIFSQNRVAKLVRTANSSVLILR